MHQAAAASWKRCSVRAASTSSRPVSASIFHATSSFSQRSASMAEVSVRFLNSKLIHSWGSAAAAGLTWKRSASCSGL